MAKPTKYTSLLKRIIDGYYEKETVFFDAHDGWYSRRHGKNISLKEVEQMAEDALHDFECEYHDYKEEYE
ncbi:gp50 [Bacillus phage W.Ph.]|uniref:Gp50 n=1 Tax=Bacillus phage W.Ph. TaxID=764595 RepID=G9B1F1_9CAUD|nr:gp50 [Bacillus phage W.Ph.]ADH03196.1 gp50 [Bacillus phage W.Ph.]